MFDSNELNLIKMMIEFKLIDGNNPTEHYHIILSSDREALNHMLKIIKIELEKKKGAE